MTGLITEKIAMLFLLLLVGVLCRKTGIINAEAVGKLSDLLLLVVTPMVIFDSYQRPFRPELARNLLIALGLSAAVVALQIVAARLLLAGKSADRAVERLCAVYGNCSFIGIPLMQGLYGSEGVFYLTAYLTVFNLFLWTHGVVVMTGRADLRSTLRNLRSPAVIGIVLGLICFLLGISLPLPVGEAVASVGSVNTPLAMLVAGAVLAEANLKGAAGRLRAYLVCAAKLLISPALALAVLALLRPEPVVAGMVLLASACPVAASCTMFQVKYQNRGELASELFAMSTLLSAVTVPLTMLLGDRLGIV